MKYILITYILFHHLLLGRPPPPYLSNVTDILPSSPQNKSNPWSSVCVCRRLLGVGLALENGIYQVVLLCRKLTFPHPWQSSSNSSLVRNGTSCPFSPVPCWGFIWLEPGQVWCTLLRSLSLYVQLHTVSLNSSTTSDS